MVHPKAQIIIIIICNGPLSWPITKKIMNPPPPFAQVEITFFTLFYMAM